jgi:hypothetical protein
MGDAVGGRALGWIALAGGMVWVVNLVSLLLIQAIVTYNGRDDRGP